MSTFEFRLNKSFLDASGHPITVPKSQLPYPELLRLGLDHKNLIAVLPKGERLEAEIYYGEAGYGEYFQIRFHNRERSLPAYLKLDENMIVLLVKVSKKSYAIIEYRD